MGYMVMRGVGSTQRKKRMRLLPRMKDSDGTQSVTLTLVVIPLLAMVGAFIWAVYKGGPPDFIGFGAGTTALIGIWVTRKYVKSVENNASRIMGGEIPTVYSSGVGGGGGGGNYGSGVK